MDWDDLRYFLAVLRHGGLSGAARALGTSPSTVARRIAALEQAMRTRLFERRPDGYEATEAGRRMADEAAAIEARMAALEDRFGGGDGRVDGMVRLTTIETLAHFLVMPGLPDLRAAHPDLGLSVAVNASFARLPQREADIGLRLCRPEQGNFTVRRLGSLAFGLYAAPAYLARRPVADAVWPIEGHDVVAWTDPLSFIALPKALQAWTRDGHAAAAVDSMQALGQAVRAGAGLGVLPCIAAAGDPDLIRVLPARCHWEETIWLVVPEDIRHTRRVRAVCAFLEGIVANGQAALAGR